MAIIRCPECGQMVSDRAATCPHCGYMLNMAPSMPQQPAPNNKKPLIIVALILAALVVAGLIYYFHVKEQNALREQEEIEMMRRQRELADQQAAELQQQEQARRDSLAAVQARQDSIRVAHESTVELYIAKMREFARSEWGEDGEYFLFDITGNGVPELWLSSIFGAGSTEVYTYSHGKLKHIYTGGGGHSGYYRGKGYVIENWAHMGYQGIYKLTYRHGKVSRQTIYESEDEEADYREVSEPAFNCINISNETPVRNMFN